MTTKFFKATDGKVTVFRASATRTYAAAAWLVRDTGSPYCIGFKGRAGQGHPATEITKAEYDALVAAKVERIKCEGRDPSRYTSPQDSWVHTSTVEG